jgi:ABC-type multidrug transport system ATPase subunit
MKARISHGDIRRGSRVALHAAELELPARANVGIIGINGAGKSTLMHGLTGGLRPRAGRIRLSWDPASDGTASRKPMHPPEPDRMAYSPQQPSFPEWLPVEQVSALYGLGLDAVARNFDGLLLGELRGLRAGALSIGQRQALSVAISLALELPLTLLDEPFAALDFRRRLALLSLLRAHAGRGLTLVSSQNGADLLETCSWMVVLREGRYVFSGPREDLTGHTADPAVALHSFEANVMSLLAPAAGGQRSA